jgi:hypothetical protein
MPFFFLGVSKHLYKRFHPSVGVLVGVLVGPHIALNAIFSAVCGRINLKLGRELHVDLFFQFLLFFFLSCSSNSFFSSSFSS